MGTKSTDKLPRGLWVGKRKKSDGSYYEEYYYRIRLKRLGKPVVRNTHCTDRTKAETLAKLAFRTALQTHAEGRAAQFRELLDETSSRRVYPTVRAILEAYNGPPKLVSDVTAQRNTNSLLLVLRTGLGLDPATPAESRAGRAEQRHAAREKALDQPSTAVTEQLAQEFQRLRQGGSLNLADPAPKNRAINSTLAQAADVFAPKVVSIKYRDLRLPPCIEGFRSVPTLKPMDTSFVPIPEDQYKAMDEASVALRKTDPDLWLVNQLLRRLGLRSEELVAARGTWLEQREGKLFLTVRHRPEEGFLVKVRSNVRQRRLPVAPDLAAVLLPKLGTGEHLIAGEHKTARENLVRRRHNAWLKGFIPADSKTGQGNHRLRKHIGAWIYTKHNVEAAAKYLGHRSTKTTEAYYSDYVDDLPTVTAFDIAAAREIEDAA